MERLHTFQDIDALAAQGEPLKLAALAAHEREFMHTIMLATHAGYIIPTLVGDPRRLKRTASQVGFDLASVEVIPEKDPARIAQLGIEMLFGKAVDIASKGHIPTAYIYRSIIAQERKHGRKQTINVNTLWEIPGVDHPVILTDTGVSIAPDYATKEAIIEDAVRLMYLLGYDRPRITILSAHTGMRPACASFTDAQRLKSDEQTSPMRGYTFSPGTSLAQDLLPPGAAFFDAGAITYHNMPHIILIPHLDAGNILSKLDFVLPVTRRSLIMTSAGPVIIPSRSDTHRSIVGEIALGAAVARRLRTEA